MPHGPLPQPARQMPGACSPVGTTAVPHWPTLGGLEGRRSAAREGGGGFQRYTAHTRARARVPVSIVGNGPSGTSGWSFPVNDRQRSSTVAVTVSGEQDHNCAVRGPRRLRGCVWGDQGGGYVKGHMRVHGCGHNAPRSCLHGSTGRYGMEALFIGTPLWACPLGKSNTVSNGCDRVFRQHEARGARACGTFIAFCGHGITFGRAAVEARTPFSNVCRIFAARSCRALASTLHKFPRIITDISAAERSERHFRRRGMPAKSKKNGCRGDSSTRIHRQGTIRHVPAHAGA